MPVSTASSACSRSAEAAGGNLPGFQRRAVSVRAGQRLALDQVVRRQHLAEGEQVGFRGIGAAASSPFRSACRRRRSSSWLHRQRLLGWTACRPRARRSIRSLKASSRAAACVIACVADAAARLVDVGDPRVGHLLDRRLHVLPGRRSAPSLRTPRRGLTLPRVEVLRRRNSSGRKAPLAARGTRLPESQPIEQTSRP